MSQSPKIVGSGNYPNPINRPELGFVANLRLNYPGIEQRVRDEGFDARGADTPLNDNPYSQDGCFSWWREGWLNAEDTLKGDGLEGNTDV